MGVFIYNQQALALLVMLFESINLLRLYLHVVQEDWNNR